MILLKQSTAATIRCGPFVDVTNGVTPETGVTLSGADQAEILKASGATVDISGATFAAITGCAGWYDLSATTSHTDTLGMLTIVIQDESVCLPVFVRAMVLPGPIYEFLVANTVVTGAIPALGITAAGTFSGTHSTTTADLGTNAPSVDISGQVLSFTATGLTRQIDSYNTGTGVATFSPALASAPTNGQGWELLAGAPASTGAPPTVLLSPGTGTGQIALTSGAVLLQATQTGVTIPTVTNLTNAPGAGDFTATMKTSIGTAVAASAVASVTGNVGGNVNGSVASVTTVNDKTGYRLSATGVDDILDEAVEGSVTMRQGLRGMMAALFAKLSGAATTTVNIRDLGDTKNRISATVDADGNRSAVTTDLT